jgi:hypothetical protein
MENPAFIEASLSDVRVIMMCSHGGAVVSVGEGTDSSTRVAIVRSMWSPVVMSHLVWH